MCTQYNVVTLTYRNFINDWFLRIKVDECCMFNWTSVVTILTILLITVVYDL